MNVKIKKNNILLQYKSSWEINSYERGCRSEISLKDSVGYGIINYTTREVCNQ